MKLLPLSCDNEDIKSLVIEWSELLAQEDYEGAIELLCPSLWDRRNTVWWSAELLKKHIQFRGSLVPRDERQSRVTPYHEANIPDWFREKWATEHLEVDRTEGWGQDKTKYDGVVHYDLPLDGWWSDLTARFEIRVFGMTIGLELVDIHYL